MVSQVPCAVPCEYLGALCFQERGLRGPSPFPDPMHELSACWVASPPSSQPSSPYLPGGRRFPICCVMHRPYRCALQQELPKTFDILLPKRQFYAVLVGALLGTGQQRALLDHLIMFVCGRTALLTLIVIDPIS